MLEIVRELGTFGLFPLDHRRGDFTFIPQVVTQFGDKVCILGKAFHQDLARTIKGGLGIFDPLFGINKLGGFCFRIKRRVVKQGICQRLQPGFARDLGFGTALFLVRQVQVFKAGLGIGLVDRGFEFRRQLFLFADALKHGCAAFFKFGQIAQAFFQRTKLGVIKPAGLFLAVTGDERNGGAFIKHLDGGNDLFRTNRKFFGDTLGNWTHGFSLFCS